MEKYQPKVSIVTVVYNDVKHIEGTILSVTRQNYSNIEYIVIDGGSTDGTVDVIKKYDDKIAYWVSEPDKGIYDAMNKGIAVATGEWILFRNCGDHFSSLSDVSKVFNGESYEGVDIIHGKCLHWDNFSYYVREPDLIFPNCDKKRMFVFHPTSFIRASLHKSMPFELKYKVAEDFNFMYKCYKMGKVFKYVPYVLALFDCREGMCHDNSHIARVEDYHISGGRDDDRIAKLKLYAHINKRKVINYVREHYTPESIIKRHRLRKGRKLWTNTFTYRDMIKQALTQKDTNF